MKKSNLSSKNKNFDLVNFMAGNGVIWLLLILSAFIIFSFVVGSNPVYDLSQVYEVYPVVENGYCFSTSGTSEYFAILFVSAALGITSFSFLTNKQQGVTMLSLPVKRSKLFNQKVILPICGLAVIVIVTKAIMISYNIRKFGVNNELILQGITDIVISLKYVLLGFTAFCVSAVTCGKKIEMIFGGISLIAIMPTVYSLVDTVLSMFLYGYDSIFYSTTKDYSDYIFILDPTREMTLLSWLYESVELNIEKLIVSAFWIVALILTLVFTKRYFTKNYKAEKIEMKATNKPLIAIIGATVSLFVSEIVMGIITDEILFERREMTSGGYIGLLFVLTVVFAFLTICLIETSFRLNKNKLISVLSPLSVIILTLAFAFSGGLGYENRIPDIKNIKSIEISTTFCGGDIFNTEGLPSVLDGFSEFNMTLTTENDFKVIKAIHETIIENRDTDTFEGFCVNYVLKDGRTISRVYSDLSKESAAELLKLWKTDATKKDVEDYLLNNKPTNAYGTLGEGDSYYDEAYNFYEVPYSCFNYDKNTVFIVSKQNTGTSIKDKLNKESFEQIKEAIYKDYCELSADEWFKPTKTYGALVFTYDDRYDYVEYDSDDALYEDEAIAGTAETKTDKVLWGGFSDYEQIVIPVTAEMKNTVSVLKSLNLYRYLTDTKAEIDHIFIADAKEYFDWKKSQKIENELYYGEDSYSVNFIPDSDLEGDMLFFGKTKDKVYDELTNDMVVCIEDYESILDLYDFSTAPVKEIKNSKEMYNLLTKAHIKYYDEELKGKIIFVYYRYGIDTAYYIPA